MGPLLVNDVNMSTAHAYYVHDNGHVPARWRWNTANTVQHCLLCGWINQMHTCQSAAADSTCVWNIHTRRLCTTCPPPRWTRRPKTCPWRCSTSSSRYLGVLVLRGVWERGGAGVRGTATPLRCWYTGSLSRSSLCAWFVMRRSGCKTMGGGWMMVWEIQYGYGVEGYRRRAGA
jgi:hypothetical protein